MGIAKPEVLNFYGFGGDMERIAEIGASIVIKGDLTADENVVIAGRVQGTISVEKHSVTVRPGAELEADVDARVIVVGGQVKGTISAAETLELQRTAIVQGEIVAAAIRLDDGAVFNGKAQTTKARSNSKLQLAS
jgi:cytoskeletal protein CcmA (bactofilin family)